jgi:hypothetical protein
MSRCAGATTRECQKPHFFIQLFPSNIQTPLTFFTEFSQLSGYFSDRFFANRKPMSKDFREGMVLQGMKPGFNVMLRRRNNT